MPEPTGLFPGAEYITGILTTIGVVTAFMFHTVRKMSKEKLDQTKDRAEEDLIEKMQTRESLLVAENDRLKTRLEQVEAERNDAVQRVGKLSTEVDILSKQVAELKDVVSKLGASLETAREEIHRYAIENVKLLSKLEHFEAMFAESGGKKNE